METCPRCGLKLKQLNRNHTKRCERIPLPQDLAQLWMDKPTLTTKHLADRYNVHREFMITRLELGGIPLNNQSKRGYLIRRMNWGRVRNEQPTIPNDKKPCPRCSILMSTSQQICRYCATNTKGTRHEYNYT